MRTAILAAILMATTATPVLAHHHHGHHRPNSGHHRRHEEARTIPSKGHAHQTLILETAPRHAPVLDTQAAPGQSSPPIALGPTIGPDSAADLWRVDEPAKPAWGHRPRKLVGRLMLNGEEYPVVSGGNGWSIPYGHWLVTPDEVGPWGSRHHAIGLNSGDDIPDPEIHRGRDGVEIHAANHNATAGCVGVKQGFDALRSRVISMIESFGKVWLHVVPGGMAITPTKDWTPPDKPIIQAAADEDEDGDTGHYHHTHRRHEEKRRHRIAHNRHHTRLASR